ncbi:ribonuclease Y [Candidatus Dependentiae bacterium]|nr:ribonuclease Y [Candidatus Dependentiae bacterium]
MINLTLLLIGGGALLLLNVLLFVYAKKKFSSAQDFLDGAKSKLKNVKRDIDLERRSALLKVKDEVYKRRKDFDLDIKRQKIDLDHLRSKLNSKYDHIDKKEQDLDQLRRDMQQKERSILHTEDVLRVSETKLKNLYDTLISKLERVSKMSREEAKQSLLDTLEAEVKLTSQKWIQKVEYDTKATAKEIATGIIVTAMQRYFSDQVASHTSSIVQLPSEDMKGRIIGKEGRNIKSLEMATGMEFIIGDGADFITVSGFNPVRREIARRALERLVADGRINPTRIEETVEQCENELAEVIQDHGKEVVLEFNLQGVHPEIVTLLGKLYFRTSFSQNLLEHSREVGLFSRMIAEELGLDGQIAFRAGLLHDIGKAVSAEIEGPHAQVGADIAKRCGENDIVGNAIAAHHEEVPFTSIYSPIILVADAISASRPGARRETLATYIRRLEGLENIARSFDGVKKAYALQAGREVRIIVEEDHLDDEQVALLAREIAKKIEEKMSFPGQIKVNVIREKRSIEYAR